MTPLSVVIITYNEAHRIGPCLHAVQGIADEILIVDSYSEDATRKIAGEYGARVILYPFENFAAQKNYAASLASHPLILSLDADEYPDEELLREIQNVKINQNAEVYQILRLNHLGHKAIRYGGWYPDPKLRLWLKGKAGWSGDYVHERLMPARGARIAPLRGHLLHFGYTHSSELWPRSKKYLELSARELVAQGKWGGKAAGIIHAAARWTRDYLFRGGFLDGKAGWRIAANTAREIYFKYRMTEKLRRQSG